MNGIDKSVNELLALLKNAETTMQADPNYTLAVSKTTSFKKKGKSKGRAPASLAPRPRNALTLGLIKILSASTAKLRGAGRGTARSIWQIERSPVLPAKV